MKAIQLATVVLLIPASILAADRPTADEVAIAVKESRAKTAAPTAESVQKQVDDLKSERADLQKNAKTFGERRRSAKLLVEIRQLEAEVRRLKKLPPPPESKRLADFDWNKINVGAVGHIGQQDMGGYLDGSVRCLQRFEAGRFLGDYVTASNSGFANVGGRPTENTGPMALFIGIEADRDGNTIQDDGLYTVEFDAVVTGEYRYRTASGAQKTVFIVEKFNPDEQFK